jgi:HlyD family secretion protein
MSRADLLKGLCVAVVSTALLAACAKSPPQALGTLEYDRITLPAVVSERLVAVHVREGQRVHKGQLLMQLNPAQAQAALSADEARIQQQQALLDERIAGPRKEDIAQARANLKAAQARSREARAYLARVRPLTGADYVSAAAMDSARAAAGQADAQVDAARAALDVLLHGTRPEQIAQTRAALAAAKDQAQAQRVLLDKLRIIAPREGIIDSLPYRLGDQAPVGAPLAVLLVGATPYARIYVPEPRRAALHDGDAVRVYVGARKKPYVGHIRMIHSEPVYTPYYALNGEDVARLSYLAQVALGPDAAGLPAGLPVRVALPQDKP